MGFNIIFIPGRKRVYIREEGYLTVKNGNEKQVSLSKALIFAKISVKKFWLLKIRLLDWLTKTKFLNLKYLTAATDQVIRCRKFAIAWPIKLIEMSSNGCVKRSVTPSCDVCESWGFAWRNKGPTTTSAAHPACKTHFRMGSHRQPMWLPRPHALSSRNFYGPPFKNKRGLVKSDLFAVMFFKVRATTSDA